MRNLKYWVLCAVMVSVLPWANAIAVNPTHDNPNKPSSGQTDGIDYRENCDNAVTMMDQSINNVRARLTTGGDLWWDGSDGRYVVPKTPPGVPEVSSLYAGAVWLGGVDDGGTLKVAAQTYGRGTGDFDFFPGPLVHEGPDVGTTTQETCANWDKFFVVDAADIEKHKANFEIAQESGVTYEESAIPDSLKRWPGRGNPYFEDIYGFPLPDVSVEQGLAGFFDYNCDMIYDPADGDYPMIEIRDCEPNNCSYDAVPGAPERKAQYGDQMIFWIYNDAGNVHAQSNSPDQIRMEVQVQAFAYSTNDEINNMTFQRFKLINRATESIDSTFFAMWADPDLGCHTDDYIGCDVERSLAYVYNEDATDGTTGCTCEGGAATYCEEVPILGIDYFRGPLDENGNELGMSSFTYYNNASVGGHPAGTTDPDNEVEYYNYLSGSWKDGSAFTFGDDAYQDGEPIDYAFVDAPNEDGWSMCTADLAFGDRRTVQATGPFRLDPGAVNELIVGVVWVADQAYPCPDISKLQEADDVAQALFSSCFAITNGPDAPDVDFIELDQELVAVFTNKASSNNFEEKYSEPGLKIPPGTEDSLYVFEGYKLYQVASEDIDLSGENKSDPEKVKLIYQVDVRNGISTIFNWNTAEDTPTETPFYTPELMVEGNNEGIRHTFRITEDQFASGDRRLINHKKYYFIAVAYAHNDYQPYDPVTQVGQREAYLEGRRNIGLNNDGKPYSAIPRLITDRELNAGYGDGIQITRIEGTGTGTDFLDLTDESRREIEASFAGDFDHEITYKAGRTPIEVLIYNPLDVKDGEFEVTLIDQEGTDPMTRPYWKLTNLSDPSADVIVSDTSILTFNQQILAEYGFSLGIGQVAEAGSQPDVDAKNGFIGVEEEYVDGENAIDWLGGVTDDTRLSGGYPFLDNAVFNFMLTEGGEVDAACEPSGLFNDYPMMPYGVVTNNPNEESVYPGYITPAWSSVSLNNNSSLIPRCDEAIGHLNNVDIVFTSNRDLWSRCVIIESANKWYADEALPTEGDVNNFFPRGGASVTKYDNDGDGLPDVDTDETRKGFGYFPGYAIDVETGKRLNIFFGENSIYDGSIYPDEFIGGAKGRDMMFNPTDQMKVNIPFDPTNPPPASLFPYYAGGQHFLYVTNTDYDGCESLYSGLNAAAVLKTQAIKTITWAGLIMPNPGTSLTSYADGLIPSDVRMKLRVENPYAIANGAGGFDGYPTYRFKLEGKEASELEEETIETALDAINVVPNPYYGFSEYETSQFEQIVKVTNLPAECQVSIYSLDGKFIRRYNRSETGARAKGSAIAQQQISPALEWDLKNSKGIPVASGVYLIHVKADGLGERTIKWFGVNRQFDASGL